MTNTIDIPVSSPTIARTTPRAWAGIASLGLGIFALVMSEFMPASLLPRIAVDLGVLEGGAGQAVTATAFAAVASALLISVVLPGADRRLVMIGLTTLAILSNLLVAIAPDLWVLLAARLLLGVALGGFWAMATAVAVNLVHPDHVGRALTVVNTGVALATIAAVPLGAALGEVWGWRGVFLLATAVAVVALAVQALTLPRIRPAGSTTGLRALGSVLRSPVTLVGLLSILAVFVGHFSGFTYIRPAVESLSSIDPGGFALLLLAFGVANFAGTIVAGPIADRVPRLGLLAFPLLIAVGTTGVLLTGFTIPGLFISAALWGIGFGGIPTTVLSWGSRAEPERLEQIGGLIVTAANLAIALGALLGGLLVDDVAPSAPLVVAAIAPVVGGVVLTLLRPRR